MLFLHVIGKITKLFIKINKRSITLVVEYNNKLFLGLLITNKIKKYIIIKYIL